MICFGSCLLNRPIHTSDLTICPRMFELGELVFDFVFSTDLFEGMGLIITASFHESKRKLQAVVCQRLMDFIRHTKD